MQTEYKYYIYIYEVWFPPFPTETYLIHSSMETTRLNTLMYINCNLVNLTYILQSVY